MNSLPRLTPEILRDTKLLREFTRRALRNIGVNPSRRRGQNFTVSPRYVSSFKKALSRVRGELTDKWALEVGTGLGVMSLAGALSLPGFRIISVEVDERLFMAASRTVGWLRELALVRGDGLEIAESCMVPLVFSSTPFNISAPLTLILARNNSVSYAVLGVQKEIADRLTAKPGTREYGRLSLVTQLIFSVSRLSNHPPREFWPPPKVSASVVVLERVREYDPLLHGTVEELSACLFSQRNRLARKVFLRCASRLGGERCVDSAQEIPEGIRVRDLSPTLIEELAWWLVECRS